MAFWMAHCLAHTEHWELSSVGFCAQLWKCAFILTGEHQLQQRGRSHPAGLVQVCFLYPIDHIHMAANLLLCRTRGAEHHSVWLGFPPSKKKHDNLNLRNIHAKISYKWNTLYWWSSRSQLVQISQLNEFICFQFQDFCFVLLTQI